MSEAKKRKKSYYCQAKRQCGSRKMLDVGLKGFLITCNRREQETTREAYNLLNECSSLLYGEEMNARGVGEEHDHSVDVDFDAMIKGQIEALQGGGQKAEERRFQAVETKTSNCIFIRTTLDRPDELVTKLLADAAETGRTKSRFILKIFPVLGTCRADEDKIEHLVEELMASQFAERPFGTYAIIYKVRCNQLSRETIFPAVGRAVHKACTSVKVDLANPDVVVSIDVLNKYACVSVLKDFYKLRKYNLQELAKSGSSGGAGEKSAAEKTSFESENDSKRDGDACDSLERATDVPAKSGSDLASEKATESVVDNSQSAAECSGKIADAENA